MRTVEEAYRHYLGITGDPVAAAVLALADRLPAPDPEPWLTVQQCAQRLNVNFQTVNRLIARGELVCQKIGSAKRIRPADLAAYEQSSQRAGTKVAPELALLGVKSLTELGIRQRAEMRKQKKGRSEKPDK